MPRLETVENCMRVSQMVVQGLWDTKSPLLQLPHLNQENLRHFTTKKVCVIDLFSTRPIFDMCIHVCIWHLEMFEDKSTCLHPTLEKCLLKFQLSQK